MIDSKTILTCLCLGLLVAGPVPKAAEPGRAVDGSDALNLVKAGPTLSPGDKLQFFVGEDPARAPTPFEAIVSPLGEVGFPVCRTSDVLVTLSVKGKTVAEVRDELKVRLDADYYQNATVFLSLRDQAQRRMQILFSGEVQTKVFNLSAGENVTLFEALIKAGYTEWANLKRVQLYRQSADKQKSEAMTFDVDAMLKGDRSKDIPLQDGDHIKVAQKKIVGF